MIFVVDRNHLAHIPRSPLYNYVQNKISYEYVAFNLRDIRSTEEIIGWREISVASVIESRTRFWIVVCMSVGLSACAVLQLTHVD